MLDWTFSLRVLEGMWKQIRKLNSSNPDVWKYVFEGSTAVAEAVLYRYQEFSNRTVICCSTQSGCPVGCRFCGAGDYFVRSLRADEIVSQVETLLEDHDLQGRDLDKFQIMFMSMGEPLLNFRALEEAIHRLHALYPKSRLLISTSGPRVDYEEVRRVSKEVETVGLQFSVHESTDEARNNLIPFDKKLSLREISEEGKLWAESTGRRPFFNYCAHDGNISDADVDRLEALFSPEVWECTVSVVCEREEHVSAAVARQRSLAENFSSKMLGRGYNVRVFDPAGQDDIGGGCGQLWFVQNWMREHPKQVKRSVGFGLPIVHSPSP